MRIRQGILMLSAVMVASCRHNEPQQVSANSEHRAYYVSAAGNDDNPGTREQPWKTFMRVNATRFGPGDTIYLVAGGAFKGPMVFDSADSGEGGSPVVITGYGDSLPVIDGGNGSAMEFTRSNYFLVKNIHCRGNGRKSGNVSNGVSATWCKEFTFDSLLITGFQKAGLLMYESAKGRATRVHAYDNGFAGIYADAENGKNDCRDIYMGHCSAKNNPGDPTNTTNHSGNGILAGHCRNVLIEYCEATGNGWDMPRKGNGPVGIWTYESDSVTIQYCTSYANRTSPGSADGGGFDLDGGVTNSVIQYCRSYNNEGSGYGIFQYAGASPWRNNIIRNNSSENDGRGYVQAGVLIWNSSRDSTQFSDCFFYNNHIVNPAACIKFDSASENSRFRFYDNQFSCKHNYLKM